jgi:hypothetical protein
MSNNELQKDEYCLPGGFIDVKIFSTGQEAEILKIEQNIKDGTVVLTLSPKVRSMAIGISSDEDAEFEIIEPLQLSDSKKQSQ